MTLAIILGAIILSATTYLVFERLGRRALLPVAARSVAWAGLGLLLFNVSCPTPGSDRVPLILIDGSLSMRSDTAAFRRIRDSAAVAGDVVFFGDERAAVDSLPRGRSRIRDRLLAAVVSGRSVQVITDGELDDGAELTEELLAGVAVDLRPRVDTPAVVVTQIRGPARLTAGDTLVLEGEIRTFGRWTQDSATVTVHAGDRLVARVRVPVAAMGRTTFRVAGTTRRLAAGEQVLTVRVAGAGLDSLSSTRWHHITVVATPGVVLVADPGDWDSRFLYRTLIDVADLPVRGYVKLANDQWRSMADLEPVNESTVRRAARGADLLILKGRPGTLATGSRARGLWRWPSGENGALQLEGDWYLTPGSVSPLGQAFVGIAVDSFPPAARITPVEVRDDEWVGLLAQEGRRGALRPVIIGGERGERASGGGRLRYVVVAADGFWRWAFSGGSSEQGYRSWVAATTSWLLGGADSLAGVAVPVAAIVHNARPLMFRWMGPGDAADVPIRFDGGQTVVDDTLSFDGTGRARVWLPVGRYRYLTPDGAGGVVAVEPYSDEWLPRTVTLQRRTPAAVVSTTRTSAREVLWLFGLVVLALAAEWLARRHLGLR